MSVFNIALVLSALLCSLVAGLLFVYAVVIMPGFKKLSDRSFIRAFQVTDRIIQDNQPLFLFVWLGSAVSIIVLAVTGFSRLNGIEFYIMIFSTAAYLLGVQVLTIVNHLPLNNRLQNVDVEHADNDTLYAARLAFEHRWNRSNEFRTLVACCVSLALIILAFKL